jgi:PPOX class probable F420-dependent enzyme
LNAAEVLRRVAEARVARLATVDENGRPHLVPICFACDGDTLYSAVDRKPKRTTKLKRLENIRANPRVSVLVDGYDEDWSRLWWVRLDGLARIVEEELERARALGLLEAKYEQYRAEPPEGPVLAVEIERRRGWAAT